MRISLDRITLLPIAIGMIFSTLPLAAQTIVLPEAASPQPVVSTQQDAPPDSPFTIHHSPFAPTCGFDEMNAILEAETPKLATERAQFLEEIIPQLSQGSGQEFVLQPLLSISVVVHVIHSGEPVGTGQNISDAQVLAQMSVLNEDFSSLNGQYFSTPSQWMGLAGTPNIQFCLATTDPNGNPTTGIARHQLAVTGTSWTSNNINSSIKPATNWDPLRYFNIYVLPIPGTTASGGVVGFSNYPTTSLVGAQTDGVTIDYRWFGADGFPVSGWRALTHETGHYLGCPHTFNGSTCASDDGIADTPNIENSTRDYMTLDCENGYPTGPSSCGNAHLYVNYMDYVTENCYTSFTNGQVNVMRAVLDGTSQGFSYGSRDELISNAPSQCVLAQQDAGITRLLSPGTVSCTSGTLSPQVTLRNFGVADLDSVRIFYQINSLPTVSMLWQGNLFPGENTDVTLPSYTPLNGLYSLKIYTSLPNGVTDQRLVNDTLTTTLRTYVAVAPPFKENFENSSSLPTASGFFSYNITNDPFEWELTSAASGFGQGSKSALFDNLEGTVNSNPYGTLDALISRHFDLGNIQQTELRFDVAYAPYDGFLTDTLLVLVATNCSQTFNQLIFKKGGTALATAPATTGVFTPTATQWRTETLNLGIYDGTTDFTIAFINKSGWGNRLFVDNVRLGRACSVMSSASVSASPETFYGGNNGIASANVPDGNAPFSYSWNTGATGATISGVAPGTYAVTVTDALGCSVVKQGTVAAFNCGNFGASTPVTHVSCYGGNNGSAFAIPLSGTAPFSYHWSNGATTQANPNLAPGTYSLTLTDANQCPVFKSVQITEPVILLANASGTHETALNSANGSASVSASGGSPAYQYSWSNGASGNSIQNLSPGTYFVTVTDAAGCTSSAYFTVNSFTCEDFQSVIVWTNVNCPGGSDGTAQVELSGETQPVNFAWSNGAASQSVSNLPTGPISVSVTDGAGCMAELATTILSPTLIVPNASATGETFAGANNGTASANPFGGTPGYTFLWSNGGMTASITSLAPNNYTVTVTDSHNCTATATVTVTGINCAMALQVVATPATCPNNANGSAEVVSVNGGNAPFSYLWSNGNPNPIANNLLSGSYTVTVNDASGCSVIGNAVVDGTDMVPPTLQPTPHTVQLDANGQAAVSVTQLGSAIDNCSTITLSALQTQFDCSDLGIQMVTLTATDASGNMANAMVAVSVTDLIPPVISCPDDLVSSTCDDLEYELPTASDNCASPTIQLVSGIASGSAFPVGTTNVSYSATDASGNSASCSFSVTVNSTLDISIEGFDPTCTGESDGYIDLQVSGGTAPFQAEWSHSGGTADLPAGSYTVTVTDFVNCSTTGTVELTEPTLLSVDIIGTTPSTSTSFGTIEVGVNGGTSPFTISLLMNGEPFPIPDLQSVPPGMYQVKVVDSNGCEVVSEMVTVTGTTAVDDRSAGFKFSVFPNPVSGILFLETEKPLAEGRIQLIEISGKILLEKGWLADAQGRMALDLEGFAAGVYFVRLASGLGSAVEKVVVW